MAIIKEKITFNGEDCVKYYSDKGFYIENDGTIGAVLIASVNNERKVKCKETNRKIKEVGKEE